MVVVMMLMMVMVMVGKHIWPTTVHHDHHQHHHCIVQPWCWCFHPRCYRNDWRPPGGWVGVDEMSVVDSTQVREHHPKKRMYFWWFWSITKKVYKNNMTLMSRYKGQLLGGSAKKIWARPKKTFSFWEVFPKCKRYYIHCIMQRVESERLNNFEPIEKYFAW